MIYIEKNKENKIVLTLCESSILIDPFYLFEFKNEFNNNPEVIYWTAPDESTAKGRYNLFTLNESTSGSTTGGTSNTLSLMGGQYQYNVYESSASTLSVSATTGVIIETGRMVVDDISGSFEQQIIPSQNNPNKNIYR